MHSNPDFAAVAGEGLINSVVDDLKYHLMETGPVVSIANVHTGALSHRIQAFKDLDTAGIVDRFLCHEIRLCK